MLYSLNEQHIPRLRSGRQIYILGAIYDDKNLLFVCPMLFHLQIITVLNRLLKSRHSHEGGNLSCAVLVVTDLDSRLRGNDDFIALMI